MELTKRQTQLLQHMADGHPTKVIAHQMGLSYHTVDTHKKALFRRIGVSNAAHAVAWAFRSGLVQCGFVVNVGLWALVQ